MTQELTKLVQRLNITSLRTPRADRDAMAEAAAAIKALAAAQEWQPIATAPKDGRFVLCFGHGGVNSIEPMRWYGDDDDADVGCWGWLEGDNPRKPPTHWRPLPAPPVVKP